MQVVSFLKAPFPSTNGTGFQGGAVINELVSLIDYAPTILAAGGISPPDAMRGRPLQALVEGRTQDWPQKVFLQISESQVGRAIGTSKWKYSVRAPGKNREHHSSSDVYCEDYLYDLEHDPRELHNLVRDPSLSEVRKELSEILQRKMAEIRRKDSGDQAHFVKEPT